MTDDTTTRHDGVLERTAAGGVIRFERHLAYDIRDVWDAITAPERLADWWLPFEATSPSTSGRAGRWSSPEQLTASR